jgi:hypothetical protein
MIYRAIRPKIQKMKLSLPIPRKESPRKAKDEVSNAITATRLVILKINAEQRVAAMKMEGQSTKIRKMVTRVLQQLQRSLR